MRTDVKLGLAVGTLLFAGVMAYVLFFTGNPQKDNKTGGNPQPLARITPANTDPGPAARAASETTVKPAAPDTHTPVGADTHTPATPSDPATKIVDATPADPAPRPADPTPTTSSETAANTNTTTPPPAPADPSAITSGGMAASADWRSLLDRGADVSRSTTPNVGGVRGHGPVIASDIDNHVARPIPDATSPTTHPAGQRDYKIKPGETFWSIAKAEYGNASYFSHIVRANPNINPGKIKAGMTIILPDKADVIPPASATVAVSTVGPTTRPLDNAKEYKVGPGDNLNTICKKVYGNINHVKDLYDLNKELIGPNPNALKQNMILKLPAAPTATASSTSEEETPIAPEQ